MAETAARFVFDVGALYKVNSGAISTENNLRENACSPCFLDREGGNFYNAAREHRNPTQSQEVVMQGHIIATGITFGTALAITISYSYSHSVLWAIFHGILSWVYVIYHVLFH
jgi:hypothetical protein